MGSEWSLSGVKKKSWGQWGRSDTPKERVYKTSKIGVGDMYPCEVYCV